MEGNQSNIKKSNKEEIVDGINKKVNIPLVSEAKEEDIFDSLFDSFFNFSYLLH